MKDSEAVLALEIGTSKTQVFLGEIVDGTKLNIVKLGFASASGVKKGDILNEAMVADLAQSAILKAEDKSAKRPESVYLAISGTHIKGIRSVGSANVSGVGGLVTAEDILRAKNDAKSKKLEAGRSYINRICSGFYLDGKYCDNPLGQKAEILEAEYWLLHGEDEKIESAMHIVRSFGLEVKQLIHSALASSLAVTSQKSRNEGVLVLDIGCGTTDYVMFRNGRAAQLGTIPVGGDHITNDIYMGLQISIKNANSLKLKYGKIVLTPEERASEIWLKGDKSIGDKVFLYDSLNKIICARFEELFTIVRSELSEFFDKNQVPLVLLTGGVSKTEGLNIIASAVLGAHSEIASFAEPLKPTLCHPEYATGIGLLMMARSDAQRGDSEKNKNWFSKIFKR